MSEHADDERPAPRARTRTMIGIAIGILNCAVDAREYA